MIDERPLEAMPLLDPMPVQSDTSWQPIHTTTEFELTPPEMSEAPEQLTVFQWQVTSYLGEDGAPLWSVRKGWVIGNNGTAECAPTVSGLTVPEFDEVEPPDPPNPVPALIRWFFWVKISRSIATHEVTAAEIQSGAEIPADDDDFAYVELAHILDNNLEEVDLVLHQTRFEEIDISVVESNESTYDHPWKVTSNGDDTVAVAVGRLLTIKNDPSLDPSEPPSWIRLQQAAKYAGGNVTVTAAAGYIYAYIPVDRAEHMMFLRDDTIGTQIDRSIPAGSLAVAFSETLPENTGGTGDEFCFVIAEVTMAAGVVSVTEQILTHNPTMWHIDMPPEIIG
jgi:hypothetical protein